MLKQEIRDDKLGLPLEVRDLANSLETASKTLRENLDLGTQDQLKLITKGAKVLREEGFYTNLDEQGKKEILALAKEMELPAHSFAAEDWKDKNALEKAATVTGKILDVKNRAEDLQRAGEELSKFSQTGRSGEAAVNTMKAGYYVAKAAADPVTRGVVNATEKVAGMIHGKITGNDKQIRDNAKGIVQDAAIEKLSDYS
jgi:hypothetical protein